MENSYFYINMLLSLVVGGLLGYLWAIRTRRPRTTWGTVGTAVVMVISPWFFSGWKIVSLFGVGIQGNYLVLGATLAILIMAAARYARHEKKPQPTA